MRIKPTVARPVIVGPIRHLWRGIYSVQWDDRLNYPRQLSALFRRTPAGWCTGEVHPTGCHSAPLRLAHPLISAALNQLNP